MKCLKSSKTGNIIRVSDREAYNATSEWKFIPKSVAEAFGTMAGAGQNEREDAGKRKRRPSKAARDRKKTRMAADDKEEEGHENE